MESRRLLHLSYDKRNCMIESVLKRLPIFIFILFTFLSDSVLAQNDFKNAGEQEAYWAQQAFTEYYQKQSFEKYDGDLAVKGDQYIYDRDTITVDCQPEFRSLFSSGTIHPRMLLYFESFPTPKTLKRTVIVDTVNDTRVKAKQPHNSISFRSISIGQFEELKLLETSIMRKRFRFLLNFSGLANPQWYYIELSNNKATHNMNLSSFMKGATVTYLRQGSFLI